MVFRSVSEITKNKTMQRISKIADAIEKRFPEVKMAEQIKFKHFKWVSEFFIDAKSNSTKKDYIRALRLMAEALGKNQWCEMLGFKSDPSLGGRPTKIGVRSSKRIF